MGKNTKRMDALRKNKLPIDLSNQANKEESIINMNSMIDEIGSEEKDGSPILIPSTIQCLSISYPGYIRGVAMLFPV